MLTTLVKRSSFPLITFSWQITEGFHPLKPLHAHNLSINFGYSNFQEEQLTLLISPLIQLKTVASEVFQDVYEVKQLVECKKTIHDVSKTKVSVYCLM